MSSRAWLWAQQRDVRPPTCKYLFEVIAEAMNPEEARLPSISYLAKRCSMSSAAVEATIRVLEADGHLPRLRLALAWEVEQDKAESAQARRAQDLKRTIRRAAKAMEAS